MFFFFFFSQYINLYLDYLSLNFLSGTQCESNSWFTSLSSLTSVIGWLIFMICQLLFTDITSNFVGTSSRHWKHYLAAMVINTDPYWDIILYAAVSEDRTQNPALLNFVLLASLILRRINTWDVYYRMLYMYLRRIELTT